MRRRIKTRPAQPEGYFVAHRTDPKAPFRAFARVPTFEEAQAIDLAIPSGVETTIVHAATLSTETLARFESEMVAKRHLHVVR